MPLTVLATPGGTDADGDALTYVLDFGDGQRSEGSLPVAPIEHRYLASGDYTLRLEVRDGRSRDRRDAHGHGHGSAA